MPCDTLSQTKLERIQREQQLKKLEAELASMTARIVRVGNMVNIEGWSERGSWCDGCAINRLRQSENFEVRHMIATACPEGEKLTYGGH